jgi:hypothetical protein
MTPLGDSEHSFEDEPHFYRHHKSFCHHLRRQIETSLQHDQIIFQLRQDKFMSQSVHLRYSQEKWLQDPGALHQKPVVRFGGQMENDVNEV